MPTISARLAMSTDPSRDGDTFKPQISSKGHMYHSQGKSKNGTKNGTGSGTGTFRSSDMSSTDVSKSNIPIPIPIHERLYNEAVTKKNDEFNRFVQVGPVYGSIVAMAISHYCFYLASCRVLH